MTIKEMIDQIEDRRSAVGAERDRIDAMISDMEGLRDNCQAAWDSLSDARDALSQMV